MKTSVGIAWRQATMLPPKKSQPMIAMHQHGNMVAKQTFATYSLQESPSLFLLKKPIARKTGGVDGTPATRARSPLIQKSFLSFVSSPKQIIINPPSTAPTAIMARVSMKTPMIAGESAVRVDWTRSLRISTTSAFPGTYLPSWLKK